MATQARGPHSIAARLLVLAILVFTATPASTASARSIWIRHPGVRQRVKDALGIGRYDPITTEALAELKQLDLSTLQIVSDDTAVVRFCKSLERLDLRNNRVDDLFWLKGLEKLKDVDLRNNGIRSIQPLVENEGLGEGDRIDLRQNPLGSKACNTDIPTLQGRGAKVEFGIIPWFAVFVVNPQLPFLFRLGRTLDLQSEDKFVTFVVTRDWILGVHDRTDIDVSDIDVDTVRLEGVEPASTTLTGDRLIISFWRSDILELLEPGEDRWYNWDLTGKFNSGLPFEDGISLRVINSGD